MSTAGAWAFSSCATWPNVIDEGGEGDSGGDGGGGEGGGDEDVNRQVAGAADNLNSYNRMRHKSPSNSVKAGRLRAKAAVDERSKGPRERLLVRGCGFPQPPTPKDQRSLFLTTLRRFLCWSACMKAAARSATSGISSFARLSCFASLVARSAHARRDTSARRLTCPGETVAAPPLSLSAFVTPVL